MPIQPTYNCPEQLQTLWHAYNSIIADPNRVTRIREGNREVEYGRFNIQTLERLYMIHWNQCGAACGLPKLGPGAHVQRGPASGVRFY